jgi:Protein of unknown function (DUF1232)
MGDTSWTPRFRAANATITKVLRSPAFGHSRVWSGQHIDDDAALALLADRVEALDHVNAPLCTIADRVAAAVGLVRDRVDHLRDDAKPAPESLQSDAPEPSELADLVPHVTAGTAARQRLLVAALHYLVTPVDLVPDFRPGGYLDDVLLLTWVFGAAAHELEPFLET